MSSAYSSPALSRHLPQIGIPEERYRLECVKRQHADAMLLTLKWRHQYDGSLARPLDVGRNGRHIVQTYQDEQFLAEAVSVFVRTGLRNAEGVIMIAAQSHKKLFIERLASEGVNCEESLR